MEKRAKTIFLFYYAGMRSVHTKATRASQRSWWDFGVLFALLLFCTAAAGAQETSPKPRIICDHAAPPRGMHWVCKSQCDCHLEGKLKNDEDGIAPAASNTTGSDATESRVCKYDAPKAGDLLVCDSECKCKPAEPKEDGTKTATNSCRQPMVVVVPPIYPAIARMNQISGVVFVQIEMADDGTVNAATAVEGHPMLRKAAEESVRSWRLNPECSRVQMVAVRFRLSIDEVGDKPGFYIHPPDEVEAVSMAPEVNNTRSTMAKKKKHKKASSSK